MSSIPTFSADGRRLRNYSLVSIENLLAVGKVAVERNRKGTITCATLRPLDGANPIRGRAHLGQCYSFHAVLPSGHRSWQHTRICNTSELPKSEREDAEQFIRSVFLACPVSIVRRAA